jgi:hypothetical protein
MGEWRYISTFLNLGNRWWVISFTPRPFYPLETAPSTQWIVRWVDFRAGLYCVKRKKKPRSLPGIEPRFLGHSTWSLVTILSELYVKEKNSLHDSVRYTLLRSQCHLWISFLFLFSHRIFWLTCIVHSLSFSVPNGLIQWWHKIPRNILWR